MSTVSQWITSGGMKTGWFLFEGLVKESGKAKAFKAKRFNAYGNLVAADVWFRESQIKAIINDYYQDKMGVTMYLVPQWLIERKEGEGYVLD